MEFGCNGPERMMKFRSDRRPGRIDGAHTTRADHPARVRTRVIEHGKDRFGLRAHMNRVSSHGPLVPGAGPRQPTKRQNVCMRDSLLSRTRVRIEVRSVDDTADGYDARIRTGRPFGYRSRPIEVLIDVELVAENDAFGTDPALSYFGMVVTCSV